MFNIQLHEICTIESFIWLQQICIEAGSAGAFE